MNANCKHRQKVCKVTHCATLGRYLNNVVSIFTVSCPCIMARVSWLRCFLNKEAYTGRKKPLREADLANSISGTPFKAVCGQPAPYHRESCLRRALVCKGCVAVGMCTHTACCTAQGRLNSIYLLQTDAVKTSTGNMKAVNTAYNGG